jgi:hypothetical protein
LWQDHVAPADPTTPHPRPPTDAAPRQPGGGDMTSGRNSYIFSQRSREMKLGVLVTMQATHWRGKSIEQNVSYSAEMLKLQLYKIYSNSYGKFSMDKLTGTHVLLCLPSYHSSYFIIWDLLILRLHREFRILREVIWIPHKQSGRRENCMFREETSIQYWRHENTHLNKSLVHREETYLWTRQEPWKLYIGT